MVFFFLLVIVIIVVIVDGIPSDPRKRPCYHDVHHSTEEGFTHVRNTQNCHSISENYTKQNVFLFSPVYPSLNIKLMVAFNISVPREKKANIPELLLLQISMTFFFLVFLCFFLCMVVYCNVFQL